MVQVMLIDDDVVVVDLLSTLLKMEGFEVITCLGLGDVISEIRQVNPDVILMDVYLKSSENSSEPDGLNILKELRQQPELKAAKVIMSSGIDFQIESEKLGADTFLHKPYMPEELIEVINKVLS